MSSKVESPGYEALAQGEKVGQPFLGVLLHTSRAATEKKIAIIRKFMKDTQLRCILYVVTMVQGVWLKES